MRRDLKYFTQDIRKGELSRISLFLKNLIHIKGRSVTAKELFGTIEVKDYLSYLKEKFKG
jgi:Zn-dependent M32 family carboxypeptidase